MIFSANLGFLFTDRNLPDAIAAGAAAGYDAVECHFPFDADPGAVRDALALAGLPMISLNTRPGNRGRGDFGLAALPDRREEACAAVQEAVHYAKQIGAGAVHVMAGCTDGGAAADRAFRETLNQACDLAGAADLDILIEPINRRDVPGYHLHRVEQALELIDALGQPNLRLLFDCYHCQISQGNLAARLETALPVIGHVQIAAVPGRGVPSAGEIDYPWLLRHLRALGYGGAVGAEYRPNPADPDWLSTFRAAGL